MALTDARRMPRSLFDEAVWADAVAAHVAVPLHVPPRAECEALATRALDLAATAKVAASVMVWSEVVSSLRWARNTPLVSVDRANISVSVAVELPNGHQGFASTNQLDDASLSATFEHAKFLASLTTGGEFRFLPQQTYAAVRMVSNPGLAMDMPARSAIGRPMAAECHRRSLLSAGYLAITAKAVCVKNSEGLGAYHGETRCEYAVTVRNPEGTASGWAGCSHDDWTKIDVAALNERAIRKCVDSADPVAIEPGRYTTILEPEAVGQLIWSAIAAARRYDAQILGEPPYALQPKGHTKIGLKMLDERITITSDPTEPDAQYAPFDYTGDHYRPILWFERGILRTLWYERGEASLYGETDSLLSPQPLAFRMTGGTTSVEDMIKATKRGVLVTRFTDPVPAGASLTLTGTTRDGLWLVEDGKVSKAIRNFRFNESPLFALNNVLDLGVPERVYGTSYRRGASSLVVPPARVQDFNFTSLSDAV